MLVSQSNIIKYNQLYQHVLHTFNDDPTILEENIAFLQNFGLQSNDVRLWVGEGGSNGKSTVISLLRKYYINNDEFDSIIKLSVKELKQKEFKLSPIIRCVVVEEPEYQYDMKYDELCEFAQTHGVNVLLVSNYQYTSPTGWNQSYVIPTSKTLVFRNRFVPNPTKPNEYKQCIGIVDKYYPFMNLFNNI